MVQPKLHSRYSKKAAALLGKAIRLGRKRKGWSEAELAERAGVSRATIQRMERGDLACAVGTYFEAATLVGVFLFDNDLSHMAADIAKIESQMVLLPKAIHHKKLKVDDDF